MVASTALATAPASAGLAPAYQVTDLGSGVFPTGVNDSGWVSGYDGRAILWRPGLGWTDLGMFGTPAGGVANRANAINNAGEVAGFTWSTAANAYRAFIWTEAGGLVDLGDLPLGGNQSRAEAINAHGVAAGLATGQYAGHPTYGFLSFAHAARFDGGGLPLDLESHAAGTLNSIARGINDAGVTVGTRDTADGVRAILWDAAGVPLNLGAAWGLGGTGASSNSSAHDINNRGQVALSLPLGGGLVTAAVWSAGSGFTALGLLDGYYTRAWAINDAGVLVGVAGAPGVAGTQAMVWTESSGMLALSTLLDPASSSGWALLDATAISEGGLIVGRGWHPTLGYRGVLLSPVPEPSGLVLGLLGGVALLWHRRRREARAAG
ncbi:MAG: hypothetical protein Fur0014_22270 [Rubrivivax sp.]